MMRACARPGGAECGAELTGNAGSFYNEVDNGGNDRTGILDMTRLKVDHRKIAVFCRKHHIRKLSFFGSVLRDDFGPGSDVDVLVEFEPGHTPGLAFFAMEQELSTILGHKVDLNTPQFLSPYFRGDVVAEAEAEYAAS
jgi:predicted nucleotidyltransferase